MADRTNPQNKAAYGGPGWSPRTLAAVAEIGTLWSSCGIDSEFAHLKSVLMHRPGNELLASHTDFNKVQMLDVLDVGRAQAQHDALVQAYRDHGVTKQTVRVLSDQARSASRTPSSFHCSGAPLRSRSVVKCLRPFRPDGQCRSKLQAIHLFG